MDEREATTRACKVCGESKPLDAEHFPAHRKPYGVCYERRCKACDRADARRRMEARRQTDEGAEASRKAVADWKRRNPEKVEEHHRREAERAGREFRARGRRGFESGQDRLAKVNARQAWRYWLRERAPDWWVERYWAEIGEPWRNPRLSESQKWRARYDNDEPFRQYEIARSRIKKGERRKRRRVSEDGTVEYESLLAERSNCPYCGTALSEANRTIDHLDPLSRGGEHSASNLSVCCQPCNSAKRAMGFHEWLDRLPPKWRRVSLSLYTRKRGAPPTQPGLPLWG